MIAEKRNLFFSVFFSGGAVDHSSHTYNQQCSDTPLTAVCREASHCFAAHQCRARWLHAGGYTSLD